MSNLPSICPDHPEAQIRHVWDNTKYVFSDGYPRGTGTNHNHRYFCNECKTELCSPEEYAQRKAAKEATP